MSAAEGLLELRGEDAIEGESEEHDDSLYLPDNGESLWVDAESDDSDDDDEEDTSQWKQTNAPVEPNITVDGAKVAQWEYGKRELEQIRESVKNRTHAASPSREDIVGLYFGDKGYLFQTFQKELGWDHLKYLKFQSTLTRLATRRGSSAELYRDATANLTGLMEEEEFVECWLQISQHGLPEYSSAASNTIRLWEAVEESLNKECRIIFIVGREGDDQNYLIDDDKGHLECKPSDHKVIGIKILKHTRDNRWGYNVHTMCTNAQMCVVNVRTERRGSKPHELLMNQLHGSAFGDNPLRPNKLNGITIFFDRGYSFRQNLEDAVLSSGADVTCSSQRGGDNPYDYGSDRKPNPNSKKTILQEKGIQTVDMMKKKTAEGKTIACLAYRTGTGKVVLGQSTKHVNKKIDFVAKTERGGRLWREDREALKREGFHIVQPESATLLEKRSLHSEYYTLFNDLGVEQVTTESNDIFWHLGRKFSLSSKQCYDFLVVLKRHYCDIDSDNEQLRNALQRLLTFLYKNYSVEARREQQDRERQDEQNAEATRNSAMNGSEDTCEMSLNELIENEGPIDESIEQEVQWFIHLVESGALDEDDALSQIQSLDLSDGFLGEFHRQVNTTLAGRSPEVLGKHCELWVMAPSNPDYNELVTNDEKKKLLRRLIVKKNDDLKVVYRQLLQRSSGQKAKKAMIQDILRNADKEVSAAREGPSLKQELINTVVGGIALKHLKGEHAQDAATGHEMEGVFASEMQKRYVYEENLEAIADVGLVQCKANPYMKASIDRLLCIRRIDGVCDLFPCEFKARVKETTINKEKERITKLNRRAKMDGIFVEDIIPAEDRNLSHCAIACPAERMQLLHQCFVVKKLVGLHAVGDMKRLLSCCKMLFSQGLFDAYAIVLDFIYKEALEIFYRPDPSFEGQIQANDDEMKMIKKAIEKHKETVVDFNSFLYTHQLHFAAMRKENLPYPPLQMILPFMLADWNIMKPSGDQVTQMLWSLNYFTPHMNPQSAIVKRFNHQIPLYNIHRLFQLFSVDRPLTDFATIRSFRRWVNKRRTFWDSSREVEYILIRMQQRYAPPPIVNSVAHFQRMQMPAGCIPVAGYLPSTGFTPHHNPRAFYNNPSNVGNRAYDRRHYCIGATHFVVDETKNALKGRHRCAQCGGDRATKFCFCCHVWLHDTPSPTAFKNDLQACVLNGKHVFAVQTCSDVFHYHARSRAFESASVTHCLPQLTWNQTLPLCGTASRPQSVTTTHISPYAQQPAASVTTLAANRHDSRNAAHPGTSSATLQYDGAPSGQYSQQLTASVAQRNVAWPGRNSRPPRVSLETTSCKCKKSKCLKKYCECFSRNSKCGSKCRCRDCGNKPHAQSAMQNTPKKGEAVMPLTLPTPESSSSSEEDDEDDYVLNYQSKSSHSNENNRKRRLLETAVGQSIRNRPTTSSEEDGEDDSFQDDNETADRQSKRNRPSSALSNDSGCAAGQFCTAPSTADLTKSEHKCLHCKKPMHCALWCGESYSESLKNKLDMTRFEAHRRFNMARADESQALCHVCINNLAKK